MTINAKTKIANLLKADPRALEVIVSISPKFEKLRNPVLRKLIAGRATISMASKIGGCTLNDFFEKLKPLGFIIDDKMTTEETTDKKPLPDFLKNIKPGMIADLDVREQLAKGKDPLNTILDKLKTLQSGQVLKLTNTFEPTPLIMLLKRQGYESHVETVSDDLVITYFYQPNAIVPKEIDTTGAKQGWDDVMKRFESKLVEVDVREMEMPMPMMTILGALDTLPEGKALHVHHKRIPVFLLPELSEKKFEYRIKEISDDEVYLLIYKG